MNSNSQGSGIRKTWTKMRDISLFFPKIDIFFMIESNPFFHEHPCAVFEFTAFWSPSKYSFAGWLSRLSNVHLSPGKPMKRPKPRGKRQELQQCPQKVRYFFPNHQTIICFGVSILGSYTHFFLSTCVNVFRWTAVWPCFFRGHPREGFQTCQSKMMIFSEYEEFHKEQGNILHI